MKILWISHFLLYPETGYGALQRSRNLLIELCKRHEVYLISYYRSADTQFGVDLKVAYKDLKSYCKEVILLPYPLDQNRLRKAFLVIKAVFSKTPYTVLLYDSEHLTKYIADIIKKYNIEIIHADTLGLVERLLEKTNIHKVLNHHNIESDMLARRAEKERNLLKKLFFLFEANRLRDYERQFCPKYDQNIVVSYLDKGKLQRIAPDAKIAIVENGVDCKYFKYSNRKETQKELIFTGSLDWYPNEDAMVLFCRDVWPLIKKLYSDIRLTIIGKNPSKKLISIIKKEKDIYLEGFVSDVRPYVRKAKVFICPIRDGGGTRLKILDALAQGIPVVSTEIGCEGLPVKDGENILIANTPDEFVRQIALLLSNEKLCNTISLNGRHFVEKKYSFSVLGEKLSNEYEQLKLMER